MTQPVDEQNGGDIVREVGDDTPWRFSQPGGVGFFRISLYEDEPSIRCCDELLQGADAAPIAFNSDDVLRAFRQQRPRQPAGPWTDLDDCSVGYIARGARDAAGQV